MSSNDLAKFPSPSTLEFTFSQILKFAPPRVYHFIKALCLLVFVDLGAFLFPLAMPIQK